MKKFELNRYKIPAVVAAVGATTIELTDALATRTNQACWHALGFVGRIATIIASSEFISTIISDKLSDKFEIKDNSKMNEIQKREITKNVQKLTGVTLLALTTLAVHLFEPGTTGTRDLIVNNIFSLSLGCGGILGGVGMLVREGPSDEETKQLQEYKDNQKQLKKSKRLIKL